MITKRPWEETFRTVQFLRPDGGGPLSTEETLTAATVSATQHTTGADSTADLIADVAVYDNTQVRYRLKGGTAGTDYLLIVRVDTSNGQKFEERLTVRVQ